MNRRGQLALVLGVFMVLVIGSIGLNVVYDMIHPMHAGTAGSTNGITLSNLTYVALTHGNLLSGTESIVNATGGNAMASGYTMNYTDGGVLVSGASVWNNTDVNVSYRYAGTTYQSSSLVRTPLSFTHVLFAVLLLIAIALVISQAS
jgi:hypothetical protein